MTEDWECTVESYPPGTGLHIGPCAASSRDAAHWDAAYPAIREAIKASKNRARRRGSSVTYYEQAVAVIRALQDEGFELARRSTESPRSES